MFNGVILKWVFMRKINKPPISLRRLIHFMHRKKNNIALIVGTMIDDRKIHEIPTIKVTTLRFTKMARAMIIMARGECLTFD
ncbi:60S ribosomal protein L18-2 [Dendrobium catenatum]|uniref:60S ribosomal protein L18-2 n=1 Tax=Dendrobium catenatum TaxID=906689 RepID=A0A2I0XE89_9ASPA|nr:60S ribosomal protein L18-2 [Dendrobium catenatum]